MSTIACLVTVTQRKNGSWYAACQPHDFVGEDKHTRQQAVWSGNGHKRGKRPRRR